MFFTKCFFLERILKMKNNFRIIISVILLLMFYLAYRGYATYYLMTEFQKNSKNDFADIFKKEKCIFNIKPDNNNFPEYAKNFTLDDKYVSGLNEINNFIYEEKQIYGSYFQKELLDKTKNIIPNNLSDYKNTLIPTIKNKMESPKNTKQPTYNECLGLPAIPKASLFRSTARYWYVLSRYFEDNNHDYETSLLLGLGIIYLSKEMITCYSESFTALYKAVCHACYGYACDSMLIWASKPKNDCGSLSKRVAKDILDFVKCEYPISGLFENTKNASDADFKIVFKHFANGWLKNYHKTNLYKDYLCLLYEKPQKFIDKPMYEIDKELSEMDKDQSKVFRYFDGFQNEQVKTIFRIFFLTEDVVATNLFVSYYPNLRRLKKDSECCLAKIEFTAIALVINSFYAEKKRLPDSIEELNSWFGEELPKNRLSGEPYKLDLEDQHLLTNKEYHNLTVKDLVFDFIR